MILINGISYGLFANGTGAQPSASFASDPDTGLYWRASGVIWVDADHNYHVYKQQLKNGH